MNSSAKDPGSLELWVEERHRETAGLRFRVKEVLFSGKSEFQQVDVVDTWSMGKLLLNDGLMMVSERDEFVYHDMIAHVPLFVHPKPKRVLVIGGGDGGTAREALRHPGVERVVMVEIDGMVVEACRKHIPQTASALDDPRLDLKIEDGVKFVRETQETFDVVLVDSTDPIGPATPLFGKDFYRDVHRILGPDGIVVAQGESPFHDANTQASLLDVVGSFFPWRHFYNFSNLTYPGGLWSFLFASKGLHPLKDFDASRVAASGLEFRYYNPGIHRAAFRLPEFMRGHLAEEMSSLD